MCLYSNQNNLLIANNDIECYKILIPIDGKSITPYGGFIFGINTIVKDEAEEHISEVLGMTEVSSGFFHTFTTKERVLEEIKTLQGKLPKGTKLKVSKAIIPHTMLNRDPICAQKL